MQKKNGSWITLKAQLENIAILIPSQPEQMYKIQPTVSPWPADNFIKAKWLPMSSFEGESLFAVQAGVQFVKGCGQW